MSRRTARRERRQAKRNQNKENFTIKNIITNANLYKSYKKSSKTVMFKESVQRYRLNVFFKNYNTKQKMLKGEDIRQGVIKFTLCDRGKTREIQSLHFAERVAQATICTNVLQKGFFKTLINENSASQKGKGTTFASKLIEKHITDFLKHYDTGYILVIDFSKYFENINHEKVYEFYDKNIKDELLNKFCKSFVSVYDKGLGLGSEVSQFNAIVYLNAIDHIIKQRFKYYGRYMDDSYIIYHDKEELLKFFEELKNYYSDLKIILNLKKTKIIPLTQYFTFLKTRYKVSGKKIIKKPCRSSITRARKRLKRLGKLYNANKLDFETITQSFYSWVGSMKHRHARKSIYKMEQIYNKIRG